MRRAVVAFPHAAKLHQYKPNAAHWRSRSSSQGWQDLESSRVPARTKIKWGLASASLKSGVPQLGQNRRCIRLPLSATLEKSLVFPTTLNVAVRKQAPTVPLPAPRYWQSRHQHTRVVIGGSALSQRTAPQRHLPVTVIAPPRSGTRVYAARIVRLRHACAGGSGQTLNVRLQGALSRLVSTICNGR